MIVVWIMMGMGNDIGALGSLVVAECFHPT